MLSGGRFEGGRRAEHLRGFRAAILDVDNSGGAETVPLETLAARLRAAGINFLVASSPSYERDGKGPRARVMSVLRREASPEAYLRLLDRLHGAILHPMAAWTDDEKARHRAAHPNVAIPPAHVAAAESWTPTQHFFVGTFDVADPAIVLIGDGAYLDEAEGIAPAPRPSMGRARLAETDHEAPDDLTLEAKRGRDEASLREDLASGRLASALRHAAGIGRQEYPDREWQTPILAPTFGCPPDLHEAVRSVILAEFVERSNRMARWRADGKAEAVIRQAKAIWRNGLRRDVADPVTLASLYQAAQAAGWSWGEAKREAAVAAAAETLRSAPLDLAPLIGELAAIGPDDLSHDHLAIRLGAEAGADSALRYCGPMGGWLIWTGSRWSIDSTSGEQAMAIVRGFLREVADEHIERVRGAAEKAARTALADASAAGMLGRPEDMAKAEAAAEKARKGALDAAKKVASGLRSRGTAEAVEKFARSNVASIALPGQFDRDPYLLGTPGGTVELRTGEMREARPEDYVTRQTSATPAPEGTPAPRWERFLGEVFLGEPEMVAFLQRLLGYALTGDTREEVFAYLRAGGRNGKGTLMKTVAEAMGDYAATMDPSALVASGVPQHSAPFAALRGARLVRAPELPVGATLDEARLKNLSGGDEITARLMRENPMSFAFEGKLVLEANSLLRFKTVDHALRSRLLLIEFRQTFHDPEKGPVPEGGAVMDKGLKAALAAEAPAILRWLINGALAWQREGLRPPRRVLDDSAAYLTGEDTFALFMRAETIAEPGAWVASADIAARFAAWAGREAVPAWSGTAIGKKPKELGFRDSRQGPKQVRGFAGIRLIEAADGFEEHPGGNVVAFPGRAADAVPPDIADLL